MHYAVIKLSDLARCGRMDARFNIALVRNKALVDRLLAMPENEFEMLFSSVPDYRDALEQVVPGSRHLLRTNTKKDIEGRTREERAVYIALAYEQTQDLEQKAVDLEMRAASLRKRKAAILALMEPANGNTPT